MALSETKTYLVQNYEYHPIVLSTRDDSYLIPAGTYEEPSVYPFTLNELRQINNSSKVFKNGMLWFEPEYEEAIYESLRIKNWQSILRPSEIESILLHPTIETLQKIIDIQDSQYFDRVYACYIGLKNSGAALSQRITDVMRRRYAEFQDKKITSAIRLRPVDVEEVAAKPDEVDALKKQIAEMQEMIQKLSEQNTVSSKKAETSVNSNASEKKTAASSAKKSTGSKKKTATTSK